MTVNMTLVSHSISNSKKTAQFQNICQSGSLYNDDQVQELEGVNIDELVDELDSAENVQAASDGYAFTLRKNQLNCMRIKEEDEVQWRPPFFDAIEDENRNGESSEVS